MSELLRRKPSHIDFKLLETDDFKGIDPDRVAMLRAAEDGTAYQDLALAHGLTVGTVKSRIHRDRTRIAARRTPTVEGTHS